MYDEDNRGIMTWTEASSLMKALGMPEFTSAFLRDARCPVDQSSAAGLTFSDLSTIMNSSAFQRLHSFNYNRHGSEYNAKCIRKALELLTRPRLGVAAEDIRQLRMSFFLYEGDAPHGIELDKKTIQSTLKLAGKMVAPKKIDTWLLFGFRPQVPKRMQLYEVLDLLKHCVPRPSMTSQPSPFDIVGIEKTKEALYDLVEADEFMHPDERLARQLNKTFEIDTRRMIMGEMKEHDAAAGAANKQAATKFVDEYTKKLKQQQRAAEVRAAKNTKLFAKVHANLTLSKKELAVSRKTAPRDPQARKDALQAEIPRSVSSARGGSRRGAGVPRPSTARSSASAVSARSSGSGSDRDTRRDSSREDGNNNQSESQRPFTASAAPGRPGSALQELEGPRRKAPPKSASARFRRKRPAGSPAGKPRVVSKREALARAQASPHQVFEKKVDRMSQLISEEIRFVPESTEKDIIIDDPNIDFSPDMDDEEVIRQQEQVFEPKEMSKHLRQKPAQFPNQQEYFGDPDFSLRPRDDEAYADLDDEEWEEYKERLRARRHAEGGASGRGGMAPRSPGIPARRPGSEYSIGADPDGNDEDISAYGMRDAEEGIDRQRADAEAGVYTDRSGAATSFAMHADMSTPSQRGGSRRQGSNANAASSAPPGRTAGGAFTVKIERAAPRPPSATTDAGTTGYSAAGAGAYPGQKTGASPFDTWESLRVKYSSGRKHKEFYRRAKSAIMLRALQKRNKMYVLMPEIKDPTRKEKRERERVKAIMREPKSAEERLRNDARRRRRMMDERFAEGASRPSSSARSQGKYDEADDEEMLAVARNEALQAILEAHEHLKAKEAQEEAQKRAAAGGDGDLSILSELSGDDDGVSGTRFGGGGGGGYDDEASYTYSEDGEYSEDGFSQLSEGSDLAGDADSDHDDDDIAMYDERAAAGPVGVNGMNATVDTSFEGADAGAQHPRSQTAVPQLRLGSTRPQTSMSFSHVSGSSSRPKTAGARVNTTGAGSNNSLIDCYVNRLMSTHRSSTFSSFAKSPSGAAKGAVDASSRRPGTAGSYTSSGPGGYIASLPVSPVRKARAQSARRAKNNQASAGGLSRPGTSMSMMSTIRPGSAVSGGTVSRPGTSMSRPGTSMSISLRPGTAMSSVSQTSSYPPHPPEDDAPTSSRRTPRPATAGATPRMREVMDGSKNLTASRKYELTQRAWGTRSYRENLERVERISEKDPKERLRDAFRVDTLTTGLLPGQKDAGLSPRVVGTQLKKHRDNILNTARSCTAEVPLEHLGADNTFLVQPSITTTR